MTFVKDDMVQPLCLTLVYNMNTGVLISSNITSNNCTLNAEFNPETKNLTIRVPFITENILTINDQLQPSVVTKNITLANLFTQQNIIQQISEPQPNMVEEEVQIDNKEKKKEKKKKDND